MKVQRTCVAGLAVTFFIVVGIVAARASGEAAEGHGFITKVYQLGPLPITATTNEGELIATRMPK